MEPPGGWGSPPWRPAPKADILTLVLYLTFLGSPCYAPALPSCKQDEYPVGSECCPKCSPGFHVKQACGEQTGTVCEPCPPGTYIAHFNGLNKCLQCQMCDPAPPLGPQPWACAQAGTAPRQRMPCVAAAQATSASSRMGTTVPRAALMPPPARARGYRREALRVRTPCVRTAPWGPSLPVGPWRNASTGPTELGKVRQTSEVSSWSCHQHSLPGTCLHCLGPCEPGRSLGLSEHRVLHLPLPHPRPHSRRCSKWLVTEAGPGTSSSRWVWWFLSGILIVTVIVGLIILGLIVCVKRRKSRGDVVKVIVSVQRKRQEAEGEATVTEALQAPPDITTVAVEETEPAFTGRS
ncbi:tumor necrosis factor receptor superfamily member 14 isoform X1 [Trachypithecus francoisi]|uniref:tumor necrosis factor receptor superfamily member 14 isoform X1 n=1 Tax=Trachypithecus francoisi TaxID=54180 RepID=UPI00141A7D7C|nr:tumor necrosis factor receptor superfamily member 14 isoform X1 [Trachypithecus francoisi]XP_033084529.1 tumor necrosis factor receptor superfamily member 14 isoform X1 [Trachypithecus francoisi]XP_033084530.1 tumor necrosis factor receptor superfamily member 14 isoform X1 [Trachypithecus francoisi]